MSEDVGSSGVTVMPCFAALLERWGKTVPGEESPVVRSLRVCQERDARPACHPVSGEEAGREKRDAV